MQPDKLFLNPGEIKGPFSQSPPNFFGNEKIIRLVYRKVIDHSSENIWDRQVFENSYREFLMQSQLYNQEKKFTKFGDLILNIPGAEQLHFLISNAIIGHLRQLNGIIPDVSDNLGKQFLPFNNFKFEILNSDIKIKAEHTIAINFFSEPMYWHDTIGNYMLLSRVDGAIIPDGRLTNLYALQPLVSIYSIKSVQQ